MITEKRIDKPVLMNASGKCYSALRKMLVCGQIPIGSRLAEVEWSQRLGAQRSALREAMALLAHDGLLIRRATGGFFVPTLEEIRYEELVDARIVLELGAIDIAFANGASQKNLEPLYKICDTMEDLHHSGLTMGFCESDFLFHQKLLELSQNEILVKLFSHSAQHIYILAPVPDDVRIQQEVVVIQEHRQILADLSAGNIQVASDLLRRHISRTRNIVRNVLGGVWNG